MRKLGRIATALLVVFMLVITWIYSGYYERWRISAAIGVKDVTLTKKTTTYVANDEQWLTFPLNGPQDLVRVLTSANIKSNNPYRLDAVWRYAMRWQILDKEGEVIDDYVYHHRTSSQRFYDQESNRWLPGAFYLDSDLVPADGRVIPVNVEALENIGAIRLKVVSRDKEISDVVVRVYERVKPAENKLGKLWARLGVDRQTELARGNVYPVELMREQEKRNLMLNSYRPIGPLGVSGSDYDVRTLYILKDEEEERVVRPLGLFVSGGIPGVIPVPESGGTIRLEMVRYTSVTGEPSPVTVRWYGQGLAKRSSQKFPWKKGKVQLVQKFAGGLLEINSSASLVVRAFLQFEGGWQEITPKPARLRAYLIKQNHSVEFAVEHVANKSTPLRLDFRTFYTAQEMKNASRHEIKTQWLDANGKVIRSEKIHFTPSLSRYDVVVGGVPSARVGNPYRLYAWLPSAVKRIRISSKKILTVVGYTRSAAIVYRRRVPEDYYPFRSDIQRLPAWHLVRPVKYKTLLRSRNTVRLSVQYRPPTDDLDFIKGHYEWEQYFPQGSWLARYLFTPRDTGVRIRDEAQVAMFREIVVNHDNQLTFTYLTGVSQIRPMLIVLRESSRSKPLQVTVDGKVLYRTSIHDRRTSIVLPTVTAGSHTINVSAPAGARAYINYVGTDGKVYLRRLANRFDGKKISFLYHKKSWQREVVSAEFHAPNSTEKRTRMMVSILGIQRRRDRMLNGWTFSRRHFDVRHGRDTSVLVLGKAREEVREGSRMFIVFDADLEPGNYQVEFEREQGAGGYLNLFRLLPGTAERRRIFREEAS